MYTRMHLHNEAVIIDDGQGLSHVRGTKNILAAKFRRKHKLL